MTRLRFLTALIALLFPLSVAAGELSGTTSYRERIAMPPEATFHAILYDITDNDQVEIGRFEAPGDAGPPYTFTIPYADADVTDGGRYAITVEIILDGRTYVAAGTILEGFPTSMPDLDLVMVRPGIAPATGGSDLSEATPEAQTMPTLAAHGLSLPATYTGDVSQNGAAIHWHLSLWPDQSFQLTRTFGADMARSSLGRWSADPSANALVLRDGAEMPLMVRVARSGLEVVDANTGAAFEGTLVTDGALTPTDLSELLVAGVVTVSGDRLVFEECLSGQQFPVAQGSDYLALETAYQEDQSSPGASLYIMIEVGIAMEESAEGPARQMLGVNRFIRTRPGISCERQMADASLRNTYWRLDQLDGEDFPEDAASQEPHLVLEPGDSAAYRAMLWCNRIRGGYSLEDDAISFSPALSTMMACPPPLDDAERQFGQVLSETTSYAIEGETLVLRDQSGTTRAIFTAIYF